MHMLTSRVNGLQVTKVHCHTILSETGDLIVNAEKLVQYQAFAANSRTGSCAKS